jgi:hypothetical protein
LALLAFRIGMPHIGEPLSLRAVGLTTSFVLTALQTAFGSVQRFFQLRRSQRLEALQQFASAGVDALTGRGHGNFSERWSWIGPPQVESIGGLAERR